MTLLDSADEHEADDASEADREVTEGPPFSNQYCGRCEGVEVVDELEGVGGNMSSSSMSSMT